MSLLGSILSRIGGLFTLPDAPVEIPIDTIIVNALQGRSRTAQQALVSAASAVLGGPRHGRVYTRHGMTWQASAPGEPPAERGGALRYGWITPSPVVERTAHGATVRISIQARVPYVRFFDPLMPGFVGSPRMRGPRPFVADVLREAKPQLHRILMDAPFLNLEGMNRL